MAYWKKDNNRPKSTMYRCSECGDIAYSTPQCRKKDIIGCTYKYCPNCGANMNVEERINNSELLRKRF